MEIVGVVKDVWILFNFCLSLFGISDCCVIENVRWDVDIIFVSKLLVIDIMVVSVIISVLVLLNIILVSVISGVLFGFVGFIVC